MESEKISSGPNGVSPESSVVAGAANPDLKDPRVVLSLLETDQVVAAKRQYRFGRRSLSPGIQLMLWALRGYVVVMLVIVVVAVIRAMHPAP
jgi:hypothetical protein